MSYAIVSDIHAHNWSAFSTIDERGVNSRLAGIASELLRAAKAVKDAGGSTYVVSGDLFHVRGQISPSVLNVILDTFTTIILSGLRVIIIPGNHDLEGKDSERLNSAVTALEAVGCMVVHKLQRFVIDGKDVLCVPWVDKVADLKALLDKQGPGDDLILHAPINGVIMGIPDHGLDPSYLSSLPFKRVFSGHYHNHKVFDGTQVYSVGAITHHTWSDVGSQAGFILAHDVQVDFHPSILPKFVDIHQGTPVAEIQELAKGNYIRVKVTTSKVSDIEKMRDWLTKCGALGVSIISVKQPVEERAGGIAASVRAGASIEQSVSDFVKSAGFERTSEVQLAASIVLAEVESV